MQHIGMASDIDEELESRVLNSTIQQISQQTDNPTDLCVICLDIITEACEARPCGHRHFDYHCLINWLFHKPRCPLCQTPTPSILHLASGESTSDFRTSDKATSDAQAQGEAPPQRPRLARPPRSTNRRRSRGYPTRDRGEAPVPPSSDAVIERRKEIYRNERFSKHVGSNRVSRYCELTPQIFCEDEELISRARMWMRRELKVFAFLNADSEIPAGTRGGPYQRRAHNAEFLLEYIIAILKSVDIMGSAGSAEEMLSDFLGRANTRVFLHELRAWLRSPFTKLEDWDRAVQYDESPVSMPSQTSENRTPGGFTLYGRDKRRGGRRGMVGCDRYRPYYRR